MRSFLLLTFIIFSFATNATVYYFSTSGNDANNGTSTATPWKTLAKFNSFIASAGSSDQFLFKRGETFYGSIKINKAGASGNPIIIGAYGTGANPIITGFTSVTEWRCNGANIWESAKAVSTNDTANMVVINGVNKAMGRYPNTGYLSYTVPATNPSTTKTIASLPSSTTNWLGAVLVIRLHHWITNNEKITAHSGTLLTYIPTPNATTYNGLNGYGAFIQGDGRTLDQQNEWYYNPTNKKMLLYSTTYPTNVQVATIDTLVWLPKVGAGNITIENIKFTGANNKAFSIDATPNVTIQNCQFDFNQNVIWGGKNHGSPFSPNFVFKNNSVNHTNNNGVYLAGEFTNSLIQNNTFDNTALQPGMAQGGDEQSMTIRVYADNATIEYNTIDSSGYIPINFKSTNAQIRYNFVSNYNMAKMDGGGIYTYTGSPGTPHTNARIHHNIVINSYPSIAGTSQTIGLGHGIYLDNNTANTQVDSNTVANTSYSTLYLNVSATNNNAFGNTFYNGDITQMLQRGAISNTVTNNIFFAKASSQKVQWVSTGASTASAYFAAMGTLSNNYYARPIDDATATNTFFVQSVNATVFNHWPLSTWQTQTGKDAGSVKAPSNVASVNDILFLYNETGVNKVVSLTGTWKTAKNVTHTTSVTIPAYSSWIGIKQ